MQRNIVGKGLQITLSDDHPHFGSTEELLSALLQYFVHKWLTEKSKNRPEGCHTSELTASLGSVYIVDTDEQRIYLLGMHYNSEGKPEINKLGEGRFVGDGNEPASDLN